MSPRLVLTELQSFDPSELFMTSFWNYVACRGTQHQMSDSTAISPTTSGDYAVSKVLGADG
jgi:hypothetical protein